MKLGHCALPTAIGLAASLLLTPAASAAKFKPPTIEEPKAHPDVWFGQRKKDGRWCAFAWYRVKSVTKGDYLAPPDTGWARYEKGKLASVTIFSISEDAAAEDRYFFGPDHRITKMIRTGHYINAPWASFTYTPNRKGKLTLTPEAKALEARMGKAEYETYFVDWPTYATFPAIPFAELVDWTRRTPVRLDCTKQPRPIAPED